MTSRLYKSITLAIMLPLMAVTCHAFDWKTQTNEELRADMLAFANQFQQDVKGSPAEKMVKTFIRQQKLKSGKDDVAWIMDTYDFVSKICELYPAVVHDGGLSSIVRKDAFLLLDYPLHIPEYENSTPENVKNAFKAFSECYRFDARAKALKWLDEKLPEPGVLEFCKVYNMGYFFRTSERIFAIDVLWEGTDEEAKKIADKVDVFFLTHPHGDHYSDNILKAVYEAGKVLMLPSDLLPELSGPRKIVAYGDWIESRNVAGIDVNILQGDQGPDCPNNVYILSFDGWRVLDQGDNAVREKDAAVKNFPVVDLILAPSWNSIKILFEAEMKAPGSYAKKALYVSSHENELGHTVDHRESFHEFFSREDRFADPDFNFYPPYMLLNIGEHCRLVR